MQSHNSNKTKSLLKKCLQQVLVYRHRYSSRIALSKLDDQMLKDIGMTKDQASMEIQKPFWKGDSSIFDKNEYKRLKHRIYIKKTPKSRGVSF